MASDTLIPLSEGRVVEDSMADDEEEMRRLRAAAGGASRSVKRQAYLEAAAAGAAAEEDPELRTELDAAAVPAPTAGRLVVAGDDLLEDEANPWSHSMPQRATQEKKEAAPWPY